MRRLVLASLALVAAVTVFEVPSAQAQITIARNPWCLFDGPAGSVLSGDCTYQTFQQCEATRWGAGGICGINPNYNPAYGAGRLTQGPLPYGSYGYGGGRW